MKESRTIEFKREPSRSFLKTVSAYANFGTGEILFGVEDDGTVSGIEETTQTRLAIENAINDSIIPLPRFSIETKSISGSDVVVLTVFEGAAKPYLYRGKAYRRSDTADIEVDRVELNRLVLEGQNRSFEEAKSKRQDLSFAVLASELKERVGVETVGADVLKTLNLFSSSEGYNNAAALLADKNDFPGVDVIRFGADTNQILDRERFIGMSVLSQLHSSIDVYRRYYQYEKVEGMLRNMHQLVPEDAFREALANALIHRLWDVTANIQISMKSDGITITSPGGLPTGISFEEYLSGHVSVLRNPILGNVFYRLDYVEIFGTGVAKIMSSYAEVGCRPRFSTSENFMTVELPVIESDAALSFDEKAALAAFGHGNVLSRKELEEALGVNQTKAGRLLAALVEKGLIQKRGTGRATKYAAR